ncbi:TPA: CDP-glycerol glycerophosphotransferase family protein [Campylobacter coli]|nr:CDP-glycerol glycerophosphotransferase family protein [Campylobacter coli]HDZ5249881.1 CDP-glycerol glycerophosphotransferase family protein [Campylobacter coli]HED0417580.1 CDP-glycerol glycerophosphotransferase family protein [Campylobacter coli]HED0435256.1 CDP-glycerol glycerophosphotransferase family protein [Campylobacter coli]HED0464181.1 CDP-glycerol glycerophosphotransferase family protein [Campylobacter coli]
MSVFKKTKKLFKDPKLFFKDAIEKKVFWLSGVYNKYLPKKHKGFTQYAIISAVYNVEKYLDDYFKSIINQRLDFKKNIFMILVDDGSIDNSANIIKKYQKKYPKNIVYLYKENGGQASARNLGLKYIQENNYKTPWVTFTDPDDFLDRNYFYEVDKFLSTHQDDDICMVGCNIKIYRDETGVFQEHFTNFQFTSNLYEKISSMKWGITTSTRSFFSYNIILTNNILFEEGFSSFEDAQFVLMYLVLNNTKNIALLRDALYFARKRKGSTTNLQNKTTHYYIDSLTRTINVFCEISKLNNIPLYVQNSILAHLVFNIKDLINSPEKLSFMSENEKQRYLELLDQNFSYIDTETILNFNLAGLYFDKKVGILNCFKNEKPPFQIAYIEDYDPYKEQILITYYTGDDKDIESIRIDNEVIYADYEKIVKYDFLDRVFCYQKRLWVSIPIDIKGKLEFFIDGVKTRITFNKKQLQNVNIQDIRKEFQKRLPKSNIWLLMDRDYEADDNAEHLYRYIMQNHPEQEIVFALRKESSDWKRLEKERFNLIEFGSFEFERIIKKASKVISSHCDAYLGRYLKQFNKDFIFLQHGVTFASDVSAWFNCNPWIKMITVANTLEWHNIADNYSRYKFGKKEVLLTGFARHDSLLKKSKKENKQILIMPTWRKNIVGNVIPNTGIREINLEFLECEYFKKWKSVIQSSQLEQLVKKYDYKIYFFPHFQIRPYLSYFQVPSYIQVDVRNNGMSLQNIFANVDLMITDYSTACSEMAIQNKPTIFYQFDEEENLQGIHHQRDYNFDYRKNGFGPVVNNESELMVKLDELLNNKCELDNFYSKNITQTFIHRDIESCSRIYNSIIKMSKQEHNKAFATKEKALLAQNKQLYYEAFEKWLNIIKNDFISEDVVYNFAFCAYNSSCYIFVKEFIEDQQSIEKYCIKTKIEILKNLVEIKDVKNVFILAEQLLEGEAIIQFKLRYSLYIDNEELFYENYKILINDFAKSKESIFEKLLLFQSSLISRAFEQNNSKKYNCFENFFKEII